MLLIGKGGGGLGLVDVVPKGRLNVENVSTHYVLCLCVLYRTGTVGGHGLSVRKKVSTKDLEMSKKTPNAFSLCKKEF